MLTANAELTAPTAVGSGGLLVRMNLLNWPLEVKCPFIFVD
jgi:hypothetical protein